MRVPRNTLGTSWWERISYRKESDKGGSGHISLQFDHLMDEEQLEDQNLGARYYGKNTQRSK